MAHHFALCPGSLLVLRVDGSAQEAVLLHQRLEGSGWEALVTLRETICRSSGLGLRLGDV